MDVAYLAGITPDEEVMHYIWSALRKHQLIDIDTFSEKLGPLGLSLEIKVSAKHELEWRSGEYHDRTSVVLTTNHREGSDLGTLKNGIEGHPGQDGLILEIVAGEDLFAPLVANITWEEEVLRLAPAGLRWDFLRHFHASIKEQEDLTEELLVAPGHHESFHFIHVELGTALVRAERISPDSSASAPPSHPVAEQPQQKQVQFTLFNPPADVITKLMDHTGALQLPSPWTTNRTRAEIVHYLLTLLSHPRKFDVDKLMTCEAANPCLTFSLEETSDGESYPAKWSTRVSMMDYTCSAGDFSFQLTRSDGKVKANLRWKQGNSRFNEVPWNEISTFVKPYTFR
jgi:hypothetical protein